MIVTILGISACEQNAVLCKKNIFRLASLTVFVLPVSAAVVFHWKFGAAYLHTRIVVAVVAAHSASVVLSFTHRSLSALFVLQLQD